MFEALQKELKTWNGLYLVGLAFALFVLPIDPQLTTYGLLAMILSSIASGDIKQLPQRLKEHGIYFGFFVLFALHVWGLLIGGEYKLSLDYLFRLVSLILFPTFILGSGFRKAKYLLAFKVAYMLGLFIAVLTCIGVATYDFFAHGQQHFYYIGLTAPIGTHPGYFATMVMAGIILLGKPLRRASSKRYKALLLIPLTLLAIFLWLLASRIVLLSASVLLATWALFMVYKGMRKHLWRTLLVVLLSIGAGSYSIMSWDNPVIDRFTQALNSNYDQDYNDVKYWNSDNIRIEIWRHATGLIKEKPLIGYGLISDKRALINSYKRADFSKAVESQFNAHNQYLQYTLRFGLFGALMFVFILMQWLIFAWKRDNTSLFVIVVVFAFACITESMLERQLGILIFALLIPSMEGLSRKFLSLKRE